MGSLLGFTPFLRGRATLRLCLPRPSAGMLRRIVACGSPSFLNNVAGRLASIVMNAILVRVGGELAVTVYGVLMYADGFIRPLPYGMCDSLQPSIGANWGAHRFDRVRAIERCCLVSAAVVSLASAAVIALVFPLALIAVLWPLGLTGLWLNMPVTSLFAGALAVGLLWFLRREAWRPELA